MIGCVEQAVLFDSTGAHLRTLDPSECHPGLTMAPIEALYVGDTILLMNAGPWGYIVDSSGECLRSPDESFRPMPLMAWDGAERLYGYEGRDVIHVMNMEGKRITELALPAEALSDLPQLDQRVLGGGLISDEVLIYLTRVSDYHVYHLDPDPALRRRFGSRATGYEGIMDDLSPRGSEDFVHGNQVYDERVDHQDSSASHTPGSYSPSARQRAPSPPSKRHWWISCHLSIEYSQSQTGAVNVVAVKWRVSGDSIRAGRRVSAATVTSREPLTRPPLRKSRLSTTMTAEVGQYTRLN